MSTDHDDRQTYHPTTDADTDDDVVTITLPRSAADTLAAWIEYDLVHGDTDPWVDNAMARFLLANPTYGDVGTMGGYDTEGMGAPYDGPFDERTYNDQRHHR